jgi:hypothetical protein
VPTETFSLYQYWNPIILSSLSNEGLKVRKMKFLIKIKISKTKRTRKINKLKSIRAKMIFFTQILKVSPSFATFSTFIPYLSNLLFFNKLELISHQFSHKIPKSMRKKLWWSKWKTIHHGNSWWIVVWGTIFPPCHLVFFITRSTKPIAPPHFHILVATRLLTCDMM